jgi:hypothetical protein
MTFACLGSKAKYRQELFYRITRRNKVVRTETLRAMIQTTREESSLTIFPDFNQEYSLLPFKSTRRITK